MISSLHFFALSSCLNFTAKNTRIYISSISTSTILYNPQTGIFLLFINKSAHWAIWLTQRCKGFELNPNLFLEALILKGPHITGIYVYITFLFPKFLFSQFLIFLHLMYTLKTDVVKNSPFLKQLPKHWYPVHFYRSVIYIKKTFTRDQYCLIKVTRECK